MKTTELGELYWDVSHMTDCGDYISIDIGDQVVSLTASDLVEMLEALE